MNAERVARWLALLTALGLPLAVLLVGRRLEEVSVGRTIEIHGRMSEDGGWSPGDLTAAVGEPLYLRLTSDDVVHGFAVGMLGLPEVEVRPGEITATSLVFDQPGKYVFYCTRWCGVNHWRMRGTIEVTGDAGGNDDPAQPLYMSLGLELDAPHSAAVLPTRRPSASLGAGLGVDVTGAVLTRDYYRRTSPAETWNALRTNAVLADLTDTAIWDLVARIWEQNTTPEKLREGERLYQANCAACHGETGRGDGVMASALAGDSLTEFGHGTTSPADFSDGERMLGASPALLQGKILRGGMGTGMPYWGPIFTEDQTWALVDYLWTFQFQRSASVGKAESRAERSQSSQSRSGDVGVGGR